MHKNANAPYLSLAGLRRPHPPRLCRSPYAYHRRDADSWLARDEVADESSQLLCQQLSRGEVGGVLFLRHNFKSVEDVSALTAYFSGAAHGSALSWRSIKKDAWIV